ncbi:MAG: type II toxin-antitoxin system VapC family toxin [Candidatus Xenobia bacterium]
MTLVLVDSNVILDVATEDPRWCAWSAEQLERCAEDSVLCINPLIYAEVSIGYAAIEEVEQVLVPETFRRLPLPWEAAFLAGKCFVRYRKSGGVRTSPLPDFYIGAHAAVSRMTLLTRDCVRYRTYFPRLAIIAPDI